MTSVALKQRRLNLDMKEGWSSFILLALALIMVTWSVADAGWGPGLNILIFVTFGGIVASLFLAKSRFPWFLTHLLSLIYGVAWIAFVLSYTLPQAFTARDRLLELGYRVGSWFQNTVLGGEIGTDPLMFTVVMAILFWLMCYLAMWFTFRAHSLWAALLPSGITFMLNLYYGPQRIAFALVPYLLLILLFTVRFNLYTQEDSWKSRRVRYDTDIVYSFLRYGATLAAIALALAWVVPSAASSDQVEVFFSRFSEPWDRVKEEWIRLFSTLQSERVQLSYASFGTTLELGGPVNLGNQTVMDVQASYGRYWRAVVYDRYTGDGWVAGYADVRYLEPGASPGEFAPFEARREITQTFTLYMPGTTQLYALGQPEQFSLPVKEDIVQAAPSPDSTPQVTTIAMVNSRRKLESGESYMVISSVASADEDAMRQSGDDFPAWVDRYLQLPDDVPQRVIDLAKEVTAGYDNIYDKATALQDYLREYTYNENVEAPPQGVDRVDYFLFESKEGYCNYYASAMAVMARAVGIPARVAAGYTQGDWERDANAYRVREYNSHAWVEVFLPRFGWIEFEPTAGQSLIVRPRTISGEGANVPNNLSGTNPEDYYEDPLQEPGLFSDEQFQLLLQEQRRKEAIRTWTRVGGVLGVSLVIIGFAWWQGRKRMQEARPAGLYYERMVTQANWWGCTIEPSYTPNEYATRLSSAVSDDEGDRLIRRITDAYVGERYGNKNPARYQPDFAWRDLRSILTRWGVGQIWHRLWHRR